MKKKENYHGNPKYDDIFFSDEFKDDVVYARFINYMQIALIHEKINYEKHQNFLDSQEEKLNHRGWSVLSDKESMDHPFFELNKDYSDLESAISKLTDKQRYVIVNHYYNKKPLVKIAKELELKEGAVRQLKFRAILSLKRFMEDG